MQGIHRKERENRKSKQKEKNTLDSYRPSHGRTYECQRFIQAGGTESMPLIGSLNFSFQASQGVLHPVNFFFVFATENSPPSVGMAHSFREHSYTDRVIRGRQKERAHPPAIGDWGIGPVGCVIGVRFFGCEWLGDF